MELILRDLGSEVLVSDEVFGVAFNESLVHQVIVSYLSSLRQGTCAQKNRSEVSGSGKKPWRQKGTGRARSGSKRSPLWRSGGVTFASKPKSYKVKINKKMYRGALRSILSELIRQNRLVLVNTFFLEEPKTKMLIQQLKRIDLVDNILLLLDKMDRNLFLASRNLYKVKICSTNNINPYALIAFKKTIITMNAVKNIEGMLI